MSHKILDGKWHMDINRLVLECTKCGNVWLHRTDRWITRCGKCGEKDHLQNVRKTWPGDLTFVKK
jgi:ribosomal protein S27AE